MVSIGIGQNINDQSTSGKSCLSIAFDWQNKLRPNFSNYVEQFSNVNTDLPTPGKDPENLETHEKKSGDSTKQTPFPSRELDTNSPFKMADRHAEKP